MTTRRLYRVSYARDSWAPYADGGRRWQRRLFLRGDAAHRFAAKLARGSVEWPAADRVVVESAPLGEWEGR